MKNYLNAEERNSNVFLLLLYEITESYLERKDNFSDEEIKWLKSINMSLYEYVQALRKRVGQKEIDRIVREASTSKPVIKPRSDKGESQYLVDKDTLEEICRFAVETHCFGCNREDYQNCPLCRFMDRAGMGSLAEQPGKCTYWYPAEDDKHEEDLLCV